MKSGMYLALAAVLLLAACSDDTRPTSPLSAPAGGQGPTFAKSGSEFDLTDRYIVVFKQSIGNPDAMADELIRTHGGKIHLRYRYALKGFSATLPAQALEGIRRNPNVEYVEADAIMSVNGTQTSPPSWGLDRVDQNALPLNQTYNYPNDGSNVDVYIIDTGIRPDHQEFSGRVQSGYDFIDNDANTADCHGHGTHVAGTVGGTTVGIAKNVNLIGVRVLDCNGSGLNSQVIAGVDWVTANHSGPSVANMSLGGGYSSALNTAVANSISSGVVYAVAAGNSNAVACNYSPASVASAITVGATTSSDARSSFSNYGSCVDIFAPGSSIYSSTMTGTNTYASWNGTSMATPHVAGVAALYLSANPSATVTQVVSAIVNGATNGVLTGIGTGSPNKLLYNQITGTPPPPAAPAAPSNLTATAASATAINLQWTDNSTDEDRFYIERSTTSATTGFSALTDVAANTTSYSNTGLAQGTTFWYRVRAGNANGYSSWTTVASATTKREVHEQDLSISARRQNGGWYGDLTVTVHNASNQPQSGVTVSVSWSGGANGSRSATTNSAGQCVISTNKLKNTVGSITMSVTNLSGSGFIYLSSANTHNPPQLSVNRP